jgi:hypothetical protein
MDLKTRMVNFHYADWIGMLLMSFIILLLFFFGIRGVSQDVLRADEQTTLGHIGGLEIGPAGMSLIETMESLATYSAQHPPLYFLTANIWGRVFSYHSFIMGLLSVFFGLLALATFFRLAKDVGGITVAIYASLLMATSALFVFYTHDIRQYSSLIFWSGMTWLIYRRLCRQMRPLTIMQLGLLTLVTLCSIYTHYTAILILIVMGVYHLLFVQKTKAWWQISGAIIFAGMLYMPWVPIMLNGLDVMVSKFPQNQHKIMDNSVLTSQIVTFWSNGQPWLFAVMIFSGVVASIFNRKSRYALFFFVGVSSVILAINGNFEFIKRIRYVLVLLLPCYLLGGFGLAFFHRWRLPPLIFLIVWIISGTNFQSDTDYLQQTQLLPTYPYLEYNYLVPLLEDTLSNDDLLITASKSGGVTGLTKQGKMSLETYYLRSLDIPYINIRGERNQEDFGVDNLLDAIAGRASFWVTYRSRSFSHMDEFLSAIDGMYATCVVIEYGENSELEQFVDIQRFDELCSH